MGTYAIIPGKMLQIGDQFDRYQIQSHLAQGGMSDIYKAFDLVNRREVVIKIPDKNMLGDPAQFERFQREMEVIGTLEHPAILKGLGSGKHNRVPFLVTEYINGPSLRKKIDTANGPMPPDQAIPLIIKIAEGMAYCHEKGVVHRDLKPENILVREDGQPVIMDFGLALTKSAHRVTYSNLSVTMGTPDYMAPEQIDGQRGDARTDVYALGTILYEMLAGKTPFTGDNNLAIMAQHLHGKIPRLDQLNPAVSPELAAVVATSLQRDPKERYPDMKAFIEALNHPETVDLSILEQAGVSMNAPSILQMQSLKAVGVAFIILIAIVALALALQALR
jgi:serine/threonine protein kinase